MVRLPQAHIHIQLDTQYRAIFKDTDTSRTIKFKDMEVLTNRSSDDFRLLSSGGEFYAK